MPRPEDPRKSDPPAHSQAGGKEKAEPKAAEMSEAEAEQREIAEAAQAKLDEINKRKE
jgi:hypothetical protein